MPCQLLNAGAIRHYSVDLSRPIHVVLACTRVKLRLGSGANGLTQPLAHARVVANHEHRLIVSWYTKHG